MGKKTLSCPPFFGKIGKFLLLSKFEICQNKSYNYITRLGVNQPGNMMDAQRRGKEKAMPNWCDNFISIAANDELLEKIHEYVRSENSDFDFDRIIPMPESICRGPLRKEESELYGENNCYDWSNTNWGTKWNAYVQTARHGEYWLATEWSPCAPVTAKLSRIFPEAKFMHVYVGPEGGFTCGINLYQDGKLIHTMSGDYTSDYTADDPDEWDEEEKEKRKIEDELFPLQENGIIFDKDENGHFHYRKYRNGHLADKMDGEYSGKNMPVNWSISATNTLKIRISLANLARTIREPRCYTSMNFSCIT